MYNSILLTDLTDKDKEKYLKIFTELPYLSDISKHQISKYINYFKILHIPENSLIFQKGENAKMIYWLLDGQIVLENQLNRHKIKENQTFGEESLQSNLEYFSTTITQTNCTILALDSEIAKILILNNIKGNTIYEGMLNRISGKPQEYRFSQNYEPPKEKDWFRILGWSLSIFLPFLYFFLGNLLFSYSWNIHIFITIFIAVFLLWSFRLMAEYITSIFAILSILILNIAPQEVVLSGFTDGSFYLALSIFTLSILIVNSGLAYRCVIWLLKLVPLSLRWHSFILFIVGFFLTPIFPTANGRISLITPILKDFIHSIKLETKERTKSINAMIIASFIGTTSLSTIFLSSKTIHFVVFGLFPIQIKERFGWLYWLYASSIAGLVLIIGFILLFYFMFQKLEKLKITKAQIHLQNLALGNLTLTEIAALGGIFLFIIGIATTSIHKISLPWIGLTVLYTTLALGLINHNEFRKNVDWSFLIYLASLIGLVKTFSYIGLNGILVQNLQWLGYYIKQDIFLFVFICFILIAFLRIFIPTNTSVAILASILFPIAEVYGINLWIIGFIILLFTDMWFFPYQSTYYLQFEEMMKEEPFFDRKTLLIYNAISNIFRILAIYLSIFFWKGIGIL